MIKVMLVDDEPRIIMILQRVIEKNSEYEVVATSDNMTEALMQFNAHKPQVVFIDIELKGSSGVDLAKVIMDMAPDTKIIFATAHSEYMSDAFSIYAFDYLVKPFDIERITHTLERIAAKKKDDSDGKRLILKGKESISFIDIAKIVFIERENNATHIFTDDGGDYTTSMSMAEIEEKLDSSTYLRSHKSYIINMMKISRIEPYGRWTYIVKFDGILKDALITKENYDRVKKMW
ncbi:MAG: response regulator transcription factor [Lachnospira sp.]|jgi:two-component system LytT family response regulator|nr:response regulator transcription factor [Lachnospira sp.]